MCLRKKRSSDVMMYNHCVKKAVRYRVNSCKATRFRVGLAHEQKEYPTFFVPIELAQRKSPHK